MPYRYEELGLGVDISAEIRNHPEVVDLLISFAASAALHGRIDLFYPDNVSARVNGEEISFRNNVSLLQQVIAGLPSIKEMARCETSTELKAMLGSTHALAYPLLRWIITSNRAHLRKRKPS